MEKQQYHGTQDYLITYDPFGDTVGRTNLNIVTNTGKIKIVKNDAETNKPIEGVTFQLTKADGTIIANSTTNVNGEASFSSLYQGDYFLKEVSTDDNYILNEKQFEVNVEYNKTSEIVITNEHKRGDLKIYKIDKDNNRVVLGNVEFQLYSEEFEKVIGTYYTDVNGELKIEGLRTGNYKLIETKTNKWYNLSDDVDIKIDWDEETTKNIENELKKGQVRIIKVDNENNEVKLEGVEFEVLDMKDNILEKLITDENGEALTSKYPIRDFENIKIRETKTLEEYVLSDEVKTIKLEENQITNIVFENEKIKGQIEVTKTSEDESKYSGLPAGAPLKDFVFEVYNANTNELVDTLITGEDGKAITKKLLKGNYYVIEKETGSIYYLKNDNRFDAEIKENNQIVSVDITDESIKPSVDIEKDGIIQTTANQEIKYIFDLKNTGNVPLNNFTWTDSLPSDYVRITRLVTGTYNQDLNYDIYYKTNKNDFKLLVENLSTQINNYIDFINLQLEEDEYITDFKVEFGTVDVGFENVIKPYIFTTVNASVEAEDTFTNKTRIEGKNSGIVVWDEDDHTTKVYEKEIIIKKLPRTGC